MRYLKDKEEIWPLLSIVIIFILYFNLLYWPLGSFLKVPALRSNDFFANLIRKHKALPREIQDLAIVTIDSDSLQGAGRQWPWPRSIFAELVSRISAAGPKAIFLDFAFLGSSSDASSDLLFAQALKKAGNVILAGYIDEEGEYVRPLDLFASSAYGVGLVNKKQESQDLRVRDMRAVFLLKSAGQKFDYGAEVKLLALAKGIPLSNIRYEADKVILCPGLTIPVNDFGITPINYSAGIQDFISLPAYKILGSKPLEANLLKDKIVLVGMTANITHDIHLTPRGLMPGIYINANSLLMLSSGEFLKTLPFWPSLFIFLLFSLAIGFLSLRLKPAQTLLILGVVLAGVAAIYLFLGLGYNFRMDIFSLIFLSIASCLTVQIYKYITLIIDSEKLKLLAIIDPLTAIYTQRYFQLNLQSVLQRFSKKQGHFFCLIYINEYPQLSEKQALALPHLIKMLSEMVRQCLGKRSLLARYGQDALSLCVWDVRRKPLEKSLALLIEEIANREFVIEREVLRISVKIAGVDFPRENIKNYPDLVLTCKTILKRIQEGVGVPLVLFDSKLDKVIRASSAQETALAMPKGELAYLSLDLEARNKELEAALEELKKKEKEVARHYFWTMHSLVKALEEKDPYTAGHSERVALGATTLAIGLNLPKEEIEAIQRAAHLHDIGKIGLPDRILHKKERLSDEDFEYVKRHQADGAKILEGLPFFEEVLPLILYHHERYDGKGYPHGLSGEMIPRGAQIIAIADSYDAMTTGRGYNKPLMLEGAIEELKKSSAAQFNPAYVQEFIKLLEAKKISAVR